ncbi:hypothetical protein LSAT2_004011, partial [Lamellibrachia satsuma]
MPPVSEDSQCESEITPSPRNTKSTTTKLQRGKPRKKAVISSSTTLLIEPGRGQVVTLPASATRPTSLTGIPLYSTIDSTTPLALSTISASTPPVSKSMRCGRPTSS